MLKSLLAVAATVLLNNYHPTATDGWLRVKPIVEQTKLLERKISFHTLEVIQKEINQFEYFKTYDLWESPEEVIMFNGGDCKDFAVYGVYRLLQEGFAPNNINILGGEISGAKDQHAVIRVRLFHEYYIIDSRMKKVWYYDEWKKFNNFKQTFKLVIE